MGSALLLILVFYVPLLCVLPSEFRVVMSVTISAYKRCSLCLYIQSFVGGPMSYLRYLCLLAHSGVFLFCLYSSCVLCTQCCQFLCQILHFFIAHSVFFNVYMLYTTVLTFYCDILFIFPIII